MSWQILMLASTAMSAASTYQAGQNQLKVASAQAALNRSQIEDERTSARIAALDAEALRRDEARAVLGLSLAQAAASGINTSASPGFQSIQAESRRTADTDVANIQLKLGQKERQFDLGLVGESIRVASAKAEANAATGKAFATLLGGAAKYYKTT